MSEQKRSTTPWKDDPKKHEIPSRFDKKVVDDLLEKIEYHYVDLWRPRNRRDLKQVLSDLYIAARELEIDNADLERRLFMWREIAQDYSRPVVQPKEIE
jgi:polyhydroxyalkanoate synthesis regulator phasin